MNPITPRTLNDACDEIADAMLRTYPQNVWMVTVDPESLQGGGYGFIIVTRPVGADLEPDGKSPVTITSRPRINDMLKGMRLIREQIIPALIKAFGTYPEHVPPAIPAEPETPQPVAKTKTRKR